MVNSPSLSNTHVKVSPQVPEYSTSVAAAGTGNVETSMQHTKHALNSFFKVYHPFRSRSFSEEKTYDMYVCQRDWAENSERGE